MFCNDMLQWSISYVTSLFYQYKFLFYYCNYGKLLCFSLQRGGGAYGNGSNGNNSSSGLLSFSKWRGQHLSMKEMEHALCEFQKYLSIEKRLASEAGKVIGQRKRKSRSNLDGDKNSHDCGKKEGPGEISLMYCDTCNNIYCTVCDIPLFETGKKADICSRCKDLDNFEWKVEPAVNNADDEEGN